MASTDLWKLKFVPGNPNPICTWDFIGQPYLVTTVILGTTVEPELFQVKKGTCAVIIFTLLNNSGH